MTCLLSVEGQPRSCQTLFIKSSPEGVADVQFLHATFGIPVCGLVKSMAFFLLELHLVCLANKMVHIIHDSLKSGKDLRCAAQSPLCKQALRMHPS